MTNKQEHMEQIEAYLSNTLKGEALKNFEAKLKADPELAKEVEFQKELHTALEDQDAFSLENTLLEIRDEIKTESLPPGAKVVPFYMRYRPVAAAAALLLLVAAVYLLWPTPQSNLYAQFFEPYPNYLTTRSDASDTEATLNEAILQYKNGDYENALSNLQQLLSGNPNQTDLLFYAGICQMETDQAQAAINSFQQVIAQEGNNYYTPAKWYLALTYVKDQNFDEAKIILNDLITQNGDFSQEAKALLEFVK